MSTTVTNAFVTQWSDDVKHLYQQKGSKLREAVKVVTGVTGVTYNFHRIAAVNANTKARHADFTPLSAAHDTVSVTLTDHYAGDYVNDLDELKTNISYRADYIQSFANALGRKTDDLILTAVDAGSNTIATVTGGLTYAKLLEVLEGMDAADVCPEDRFFITTPAQVKEAMAIEQLTSGDYTSLRGINGGQIDSALGFNWITSNRLTALGINSNFGLAKPSLGLAVGQDIATRSDFSADKQETAVVSKMSMGAVIIDPAGVVDMPLT